MSSEPQSDADPLSAIRRAYREKWQPADRGTTHWFGCEENHTRCAISKLLALYDAALARIAALEAAQEQR